MGTKMLSIHLTALNEILNVASYKTLETKQKNMDRLGVW